MKIALVRLSALGDVVHGLPVAAAVRARLPGARITWIVERRHGTLLHGHPAVDEVVSIDTERWRRARRPHDLREAARQLTAVVRGLRRTRFDVAIDLQGLLKSGVVTALTGAPIRIGFDRARCREPLSVTFTNRRVTPPSSAVHVVDQNLALLSGLDITATGAARFELPSEPRAEALADEFFSASGLKPRDRVVVLNPGAGRPAKRWPPASFGALCRRITERGAGKIVVAWGPGERELARQIVETSRSSDAIEAPATDVHGLLAILRRASALVSGDSGPLHMAAAVGVPCVGLFGPTSALRNGPYGAIHRTIQGRDGTLSGIGSDEVVTLVGELLR